MKRGLTLVIYLLVLAVLIAARQFYKQPLQDASLNFIKKIQEGKSGNPTGTWTIVSGETDGVLQFGTFSLFMVRMPNRELAFYLVIVLATMISLRDLLAIIYAEPRPYWMTSEIHGFTCTTDYGNPSFHSMSASSFMTILWLYYADHAFSDDGPTWTRRKRIIGTILGLIFIGFNLAVFY